MGEKVMVEFSFCISKGNVLKSNKMKTISIHRRSRRRRRYYCAIKRNERKNQKNEMNKNRIQKVAKL